MRSKLYQLFVYFICYFRSFSTFFPWSRKGSRRGSRKGGGPRFVYTHLKLSLGDRNFQGGRQLATTHEVFQPRVQLSQRAKKQFIFKSKNSCTVLAQKWENDCNNIIILLILVSHATHSSDNSRRHIISIILCHT